MGASCTLGRSAFGLEENPTLPKLCSRKLFWLFQFSLMDSVDFWILLVLFHFATNYICREIHKATKSLTPLKRILFVKASVVTYSKLQGMYKTVSDMSSINE